MTAKKVTATLKAWHLVEAVTPSQVPDRGNELSKSLFKDEKYRAAVESALIDGYTWQAVQLKDEQAFGSQSHYYMNCFEQSKLVRFLRDHFKSKEEIINEDSSMLFSFVFSVDHKGKYIADSLFVPIVMFLIKKLNDSSTVDYDLLQANYDSQMSLFKEQTEAAFLNGINEQSLREVKRLYSELFGEIGNADRFYIETEVKKIKSLKSKMNFNSFYLKDLQQILEKDSNETIRQFIEGADKKVDIDENRKYIEHTLQPKFLPAGRWLSPVEHRLSLMQQVAVNQIMNNGQNIDSVNGPPGTGKTTLLKEIFANVVVNRALEMAKLQDPKQGFTFEKKVTFDDPYSFSISILNEELTNFSMVVASSNNGAVENISKELPQKEEAIRSPNEERSFPEYEKVYADTANQLAFFPETAEKMLGKDEEAWGLFSGALGKSGNISDFSKVLMGSKDDPDRLISQLQKTAAKSSTRDWQQAVEEFQGLHASIEEKKSKLQKLAEQFGQFEIEQTKLLELKAKVEENAHEELAVAENMKQLEINRELTESELAILPNLPFFQKMLGKKDVKRDEIKKELVQYLGELKTLHSRQFAIQQQRNDLQDQQQQLEEQQQSFFEKLSYYEKQGLVLPTEEYWQGHTEAYEKRQKATIWLTDELNFERGLLFLKAMKLHKLFLAFNYVTVKDAIRLLMSRNKLNLNDEDHVRYLKNMWNIIHLITPVVSTTFASLSSMYRGIDKDFIHYLFIDEAGQASPQQAAGALWRSRKAIVVGDPIQIEPVVTIDQTILTDIRKHYKLEEDFIGNGASVQSLADRANPTGTWKISGDWIGTPLWVHRRCLDPMFSIANEIAYEGKMVIVKKEIGQVGWYDCSGKAINRQYVKEQGELIAELIAGHWSAENKEPTIFVITPFTAVKDGLKTAVRRKLKALSIEPQKITDWIEKSIGTVHTFQGKEAEIVYFVAGTDADSDGAAQWSCSKPNLLNVAVTRAKKEFYIVADYQRFATKKHYETIAKYIAVKKIEVKI
ncbi:putative DNA helicase [Planococcus antarcticus DSM 14505]|uniref:DNA helicase n=1 Tax=Planococcus antarcticus DSM 14505 TaxID=1185653 RepID=A0AA87INH7_9BACL|nr:AAA domain-containing protein [Planococcus antarcticus]EIM08043.1 putative DNA helicase [Planococcus antarcticus DSM 14505]